VKDEPSTDAELSNARAEEARCEESLRLATEQAKAARTQDEWVGLWPEVRDALNLANATLRTETARIQSIQRFEDCLFALPETFRSAVIPVHELRNQAKRDLERLRSDQSAPVARLRELEGEFRRTTVEWRLGILEARESYIRSLSQRVESAKSELEERIQSTVDDAVRPLLVRLRAARMHRARIEQEMRRERKRLEQEAVEAERSRVLAEQARLAARREEEARQLAARQTRAISAAPFSLRNRPVSAPTALLRWKREKLSQLRHMHRVGCLLHLTHATNLPSILRSGVLPHSRVVAHRYVPIDNKDVQMRRESRRVTTGPGIERCVHDMVPLFLVPLTPMLFACTEFMPDLAFLKIDLDYLAEGGVEVVFSDGNIAAKATETWYSLNFLDRIPWDVLRAERWTSCEDGKRRRAAEFLVFPEVPARAIRGVVVPTEAQAIALRRTTVESHLAIEANPEWFPGDWRVR